MRAGVGHGATAQVVHQVFKFGPASGSLALTAWRQTVLATVCSPRRSDIDRLPGGFQFIHQLQHESPRVGRLDERRQRIEQKCSLAKLAQAHAQPRQRRRVVRAEIGRRARDNSTVSGNNNRCDGAVAFARAGSAFARIKCVRARRAGRATPGRDPIPARHTIGQSRPPAATARGAAEPAQSSRAELPLARWVAAQPLAAERLALLPYENQAGVPGGSPWATRVAVLARTELFAAEAVVLREIPRTPAGWALRQPSRRVQAVWPLAARSSARCARILSRENPAVSRARPGPPACRTSPSR